MLYIYQVVNEIKNKPLKVMTLKAACPILVSNNFP